MITRRTSIAINSFKEEETIPIELPEGVSILDCQIRVGIVAYVVDISYIDIGISKIVKQEFLALRPYTETSKNLIRDYRFIYTGRWTSHTYHLFLKNL